jgi:LysM repeat protein
MNRRDTIIIAVLLNAGVLAILFLLAVHENEETRNPVASPAIVRAAPANPSDSHLLAARSSDSDPVDIEEAGIAEEESPYPVEAYTFPEEKKKEPLVKAPVEPLKKNVSENFVEIIVKRGDSLDKLARNNGTSIEEIKKTNQLKSDMLSIGQVLLMPKAAASPVAQKVIEKKKAAQDISDNASFYTLKTGDSPWKIARQHHMNLDDLLRLNHLDEEKARNLKVGDKIRIK